MIFFIYPAIIFLTIFSFILPAPSYASANGNRGVEVIYPLFYGNGPACAGAGINAAPGGTQAFPYAPRFDGELTVEVREIKDGVDIRLTSEDEKTMKGLRLMGRMMKLLNDMKALGKEGR